ncbi:MAG TPA: hypothetical protein VK907_01360, partial [Phnomibacter sp.]|nr:hypothetical protein [Phnomibacter sp.]
MPFKLFATLVTELGQTTKTNEKLALLKEYFTNAPDNDKVWAVALFTGRRPKRLVSGSLMGEWCMERTGLPAWLFTECYSMVGDLSETIALLLPKTSYQVHDPDPNPNPSPDPHPDPHPTSNPHPHLSTLTLTLTHPTLTHLLNEFTRLLKASADEKKNFVIECWQQFNTPERFVFNKLMSANFRVGVSANLPIQALAQILGLTVAEVAHRISGKWDPANTTFDSLLLHPGLSSDNSKPYPFFLAYPLEDSPDTLGGPNEWMAEWKWDGIRGQVIRRGAEGFIWSRGEELITEKFPEFEWLFALLPNGVCLDGEIVALPANYSTVEPRVPAPFSMLQKRIGRKNLTKKILAEVPAGFIAYDLLEMDGNDLRHRPLGERRQLLEQLFASINHPAFSLSSSIRFNT